MKIVVLGATGMLGAALIEGLHARPGIELVGTYRTEPLVEPLRRAYPGVTWRRLDAEAPHAHLREALDGAAWVLNAIGAIKQRFAEDDPRGAEWAIAVNALFPYRLAHAAGEVGARVLQIATDCVYDGLAGGYTESDRHDAVDLYGRTKSLGEVRAPHVHHLRCSIIGRERFRGVSLLEWFLSQPKGAKVRGFRHHRWNGVTTLHFTKLLLGIVGGAVALPHLLHVVPADVVDKAALLESFRAHSGRADIAIEAVSGAPLVDRSLATERPDLNACLWEAAGYTAPPCIDAMVRELLGGAAAPGAQASRGASA